MSGQNSGGVPIFTIQQGGDSRIISVTDGRDNSHSSSADTFVKIVYEGKEVTSSEVKGYEKYSIITTVISEIWRKESGDVSNKAINSSAHLGMREVEFCMPYSEVSNAVMHAVAQGKKATITFVRTANIAGHNVPVLEIAYTDGQFVNLLNVLQNGNIGSDTFRFKARNVEFKRTNYDKDGKPGGNVVSSINFVDNSSK